MPFNMRMSGLQAAVGVAQLGRLSALVEHHRWFASAYAERLEGVEGITLPAPCVGGEHVYWMYTIHVDPERYGVDAYALRCALAAEGAETRPVFTPLHAQPVLAPSAGVQGPFPNAEWAARTGINLPSGATLNEEQIDRVCRVIRETSRP